MRTRKMNRRQTDRLRWPQGKNPFHGISNNRRYQRREERVWPSIFFFPVETLLERLSEN